jgi:uncharacterized protein (TIGR02594 family)
MAKEPKWITLAREEIGTHEIAGEHDNPAIMRYYADAGHPEIRHDEISWCAAYASAMLERAGEHSPKTLSARDFMRWGKPLKTPKPGCICVFSRGDPRGWQGHVGFYVGEENGQILLLGGNQSDQVSIEHVSKARLLGYRWPVTASNSSTIKSVATGLGGTVATATAAASQIATAAPDQTLKIGAELKGLASWAPWLGLAGSIVILVTLACVAWAHYRDLAKNGK